MAQPWALQSYQKGSDKNGKKGTISNPASARGKPEQ